VWRWIRWPALVLVVPFLFPTALVVWICNELSFLETCFEGLDVLLGIKRPR
jgi:hypothetical protein